VYFSCFLFSLLLSWGKKVVLFSGVSPLFFFLKKRKKKKDIYRISCGWPHMSFSCVSFFFFFLGNKGKKIKLLVDFSLEKIVFSTGRAIETTKKWNFSHIKNGLSNYFFSFFPFLIFLYNIIIYFWRGMFNFYGYSHWYYIWKILYSLKILINNVRENIMETYLGLFYVFRTKNNNN